MKPSTPIVATEAECIACYNALTGNTAKLPAGVLKDVRNCLDAHDDDEACAELLASGWLDNPKVTSAWLRGYHAALVERRWRDPAADATSHQAADNARAAAGK